MQVDPDAAQGDFEAFCADAHPRLVAALAFHCGDRFLAEELAQEALIRAGDRWGRVGDLDSPLGWTFRVGANLASSTFRRRGAERRAMERVRNGDAAMVANDPDGGDAVAVRAALDELTDRQRRVIVMRYYLGLSAEDTASALGVGAGSVRMLSHRAMAHLRQLLGEPAGEEVHDG